MKTTTTVSKGADTLKDSYKKDAQCTKSLNKQAHKYNDDIILDISSIKDATEKEMNNYKLSLDKAYVTTMGCTKNEVEVLKSKVDTLKRYAQSPNYYINGLIKNIAGDYDKLDNLSSSDKAKEGQMHDLAGDINEKLEGLSKLTAGHNSVMKDLLDKNIKPEDRRVMFIKTGDGSGIRVEKVESTMAAFKKLFVGVEAKSYTKKILVLLK